MKKNILVTGDKGFVGKHLTKLLDKLELPWIGYDILDGYDTRDAHNLEYIFDCNQIRYVIHLAARAGVRRGQSHPEEYISTNILGTQNVVNMCNKFKIENLIFFSSSSVHGNAEKPPITEDSEKEPISLYGITKLAGEKIVNMAECQTTTIVPFTIYGENGRKDEVIYRWLEQYKSGLPITVYGDGSSYRGYVYVKDLVEATIALLYKKFDKRHNDFNLGGSEIIYLKDIVKIFKESFQDAKFAYIDMPPEDIYENFADISKAKEAVGFDPKPNFINNLKKIIADYKYATKNI